MAPARDGGRSVPPVDDETRGQAQQVGAVVEGGEMRKEVELPKLQGLYEFPDLLEKFRAMLREVEVVKNNDYMFQVGE